MYERGSSLYVQGYILYIWGCVKWVYIMYWAGTDYVAIYWGLMLIMSLYRGADYVAIYRG